MHAQNHKTYTSRILSCYRDHFLFYSKGIFSEVYCHHSQKTKKLEKILPSPNDVTNCVNKNIYFWNSFFVSSDQIVWKYDPMDKIKNDGAVKTNLLMYITWVCGHACGHGRLPVMKLMAMHVHIKHTCNPMLYTSTRLSWSEDYLSFNVWGLFPKYLVTRIKKRTLDSIRCSMDDLEGSWQETWRTRLSLVSLIIIREYI